MSDNPAPYPVEKNYPPGGYPQQQQQQPTQYPGGYQPVPTGPPGGAVYYAPPGPGGVPQQQYVVAQGAPVVVMTGSPARPSFGLHMCLACFALWCCGGLFGLIAFILIIIAQQSSTTPDSARSYGRWSLGLSITGIVIGVIATIVIIIFIVGVFAVAIQTVREMCPFMAEGKCYEQRQMSTQYECLDGHWFNNYCYRGEINFDSTSTTVRY